MNVTPFTSSSSFCALPVEGSSSSHDNVSNLRTATRTTTTARAANSEKAPSSLLSSRASRYPAKAPADHDDCSSPTTPTKRDDRRRPRPVRPPLSSAAWVSLQDCHNGKTYMDVGATGVCSSSSSQRRRRTIVPYFDATATVHAVQQQWYTITSCDHCHTSLACIYGLEWVLCPACNATTPLEDDDSDEAASHMIPFGVGLGLSRSHILQALQEEPTGGLAATTSATTTRPHAA